MGRGLEAGMKRRDFLTVVGGLPRGPCLRRRKKSCPVIAFLNSGAADATASKALMSLTESRGFAKSAWSRAGITCRYPMASGDPTRFPALRAELVEGNPSAIIVGTILAVKAAQNLTRTVPIVMTGIE